MPQRFRDTPLIHGFSDRDIVGLRAAKNDVDFDRPYAFVAEPELSAAGVVEAVATIFLTNRECPFHCLMCDLWKNTLDEPTPPGAIPRQIDFALERLPKARVVKLYNSGNFFDAQAIPPSDHAAIARRLDSFDTVIVENHPKLCGEACLRFRDLLRGELEIALGLETAHEGVLAQLNKRMTLEDFSHAAGFLRANRIAIRSFVLLRPPGLSDSEGVDWAKRSVAFAFDQGVRCCGVVPTRAGNGVMDRIAEAGMFSAPSFAAIEDALDACISLKSGRVFMDLWDIEQFSRCTTCVEPRVLRLEAINHTQSILPPIICDCRRPLSGEGTR